jgi:large subunit ribosomal protein L10
MIKLDIKPMDVGLVLQAAFYNGDVYEPSVLAVDETAILAQIQLAAVQAFQPVRQRGDPDKGHDRTDPHKGGPRGTHLPVEAAIYEKDVVDAIIGKAQKESIALKSIVR